MRETAAGATTLCRCDGGRGRYRPVSREGRGSPRPAPTGRLRPSRMASEQSLAPEDLPAGDGPAVGAEACGKLTDAAWRRSLPHGADQDDDGTQVDLWPEESHRRRCDSLLPVAVAAEAQSEALLLGELAGSAAWLPRVVGGVQASAAWTCLLAGFLCKVLVNRQKERPEPGGTWQIVIHDRVLRSRDKPRSTPLGKRDPVIRLFEGNFFGSLSDVAQESRTLRRLAWPRTRPGETAIARSWVTPRLSFNPPPALRPGETSCAPAASIAAVGFNPPPAVRPGETRRCTSRLIAAIGFNPPPAVRPGETAGRLCRQLGGSFNPPPAVRPGETACERHGCLGRLFQSAPGGEAGGNCPRRMVVVRRRPGFNPPPALRPGETAWSATECWSNAWFQSAPGGEAGGNRAGSPCTRGPASFNPPPAVRPGETTACAIAAATPVSIRPRR